MPLIVRVPEPTPTLPKVIAPLLKRDTLLAPLLERTTWPVRLLVALAKVNTPALPVKVAVPALAACVIAVDAAWVMPIPLMVRAPVPTLTLPKVRAPLLGRDTALAPLF